MRSAELFCNLDGIWVGCYMKTEPSLEPRWDEVELSSEMSPFWDLGGIRWSYYEQNLFPGP